MRARGYGSDWQLANEKSDGKKVEILVPKRGRKEKMLELAAQNAKIVLRQDKDRIKREEERTTGALKEIEGWLNLTHIDRIEAYDISNTSGMESVGSMVVFEGGKPKRNDYRKFRIKSVQGPNDYASMYEVLTSVSSVQKQAVKAHPTVSCVCQTSS